MQLVSCKDVFAILWKAVKLLTALPRLCLGLPKALLSMWMEFTTQGRREMLWARIC